jgi:DNA-binding MarR family transcriptional regulator
MIRDSHAGSEQTLAEVRYQLRRFLHFSEGAARAAGLEPQQHQLLLALRGLDAGGEVTIGGLAERLVLRPNSTVELVNRMARRGLVSRMRAPEDHRQVLVHITARGGRVLQRLSRHHLSELRSAGPQLIRALESVVAGSPGKRTRRPARRAVPGNQG